MSVDSLVTCFYKIYNKRSVSLNDATIEISFYTQIIAENNIINDNILLSWTKVLITTNLHSIEDSINSIK